MILSHNMANRSDAKSAQGKDHENHETPGSFVVFVIPAFRKMLISE